jgi:hypothetical protein
VTSNSITVKGSGRGIHVEGPLLQTNLILNNTFALNSGEGMLIAVPPQGGSGTVISGNTISGSGAYGIFINAHGTPNAGGILISNNLITGFKKPVSIR